MKLLLISNYLTPHQIPLSNALSSISFFHFFESAIRPDDLPIGWSAKGTEYPYVVSKEELCKNINDYILEIGQADVVIYGSAPFELIKPRLRKGKLTFRYSERIYKQPCPKYELPLRVLKYYWQNDRFKNHYLLCANPFSRDAAELLLYDFYADHAQQVRFQSKSKISAGSPLGRSRHHGVFYGSLPLGGISFQHNGRKLAGYISVSLFLAELIDKV